MTPPMIPRATGSSASQAPFSAPSVLGRPSLSPDNGLYVGYPPTQTMTWVILPQALKNMVPSLVTQMIVLFKDTSLASIIGYVDLTKAAQIVNNREIKPFELYLFIAVVYWLCTYSMSAFARRFERRAA